MSLLLTHCLMNFPQAEDFNLTILTQPTYVCHASRRRTAQQGPAGSGSQSSEDRLMSVRCPKWSNPCPLYIIVVVSSATF
ncbi:unnamed protein product [Nezara viridula]|uniref:Uncharacterized protein n=1 Tax=Nezara viridula TaxID=85310 RepID=A0A9P0MPP1_NEZVI|nr:unnamed protein product [Nezara viridula]